MHGDDVASSMTSIATQTVSKATEIFLEMLKVMMEERRRKQALSSDDPDLLPGGEVAYNRLKAGGEISKLPSFAKEDYAEFVKQAKKLDIPVAAMQENGKENTLSVFFNEKDKEAVNAIVQDIIRAKLAQPEQSERMITVEKEQVEGFQMYCSNHDIPAHFMETSSGVNCIYNVAYEKQMEAAVADFQNIRAELKNTAMSVQKDDKGRLSLTVSDTGQDKSLTMRFCTKAKLERVLREQLGYSEIKAAEAANPLISKLSDKQKSYFLSGSRELEHMAYYEKGIQFENDNILTQNYSFCKMQFQQEEAAKLTITDDNGQFVVLSEMDKDRASVECSIRQYLKVDDNETVKAIMEKTERLGFTESVKREQFKEYTIERETQTAFTVTGGSTVLKLDLSDRKTAQKALQDNFGMSPAKAGRILDKAQQQSVVNQILQRTRQKAKETAEALKHKKRERGSRK